MKARFKIGETVYVWSELRNKPLPVEFVYQYNEPEEDPVYIVQVPGHSPYHYYGEIYKTENECWVNELKNKLLRSPFYACSKTEVSSYVGGWLKGFAESIQILEDEMKGDNK